MGWKGNVRSLNAALNQIERDKQRRQREYERQQQQLAKMATLERAALEVQIFELYIHDLVTQHHNDAPDVDWSGLSNSTEPVFEEPAPSAKAKAEQDLAAYKPSRLSTKKRQEAVHAELEAAVERARIADEQSRLDSLAHHEAAVGDWRSARDLAQRVLAGDRKAWREASISIDSLAPTETLRFINLNVPDVGDPMVIFGAQSQDIVPVQQKSLLQSGKLSTKAMPKGRGLEIYQDYVCGMLLWVANTVLGLLPIPEIIVTGSVKMVNSSTGHLEETPIISALVPRATIAQLNLTRLDPSDGLANFKHVVSFKATQGFSAIVPISR